jgi:aminoglycoside 3-N-acetyltransferase
VFAGNTRTIKGSIKKQLKVLRHQYAKTFHSFTPDELLLQLRQLGLAHGDVVLVHSSFDAFTGFTGKPSDVIDALQKAIGPDGTLLMPTLPFTGTAVEYVRLSPVFDVARTPSRMGLITELFRRSPGVVRSVHPTHPVALWGKDAGLMASGHHSAGTPCGKGTPFASLLERNGKILLLGADIDSLTFYHMIEEAIEPRLPASPFTQQLFVLTSKQEDGSMVKTQTRLFEPAVSRRRNLQKLVPELKRLGAWRQRRIGPLVMTLLNAKDVYAAVLAMLDRGIYCYD